MALSPGERQNPEACTSHLRPDPNDVERLLLDAFAGVLQLEEQGVQVNCKELLGQGL